MIDFEKEAEHHRAVLDAAREFFTAHTTPQLTNRELVRTHRELMNALHRWLKGPV